MISNWELISSTFAYICSRIYVSILVWSWLECSHWNCLRNIFFKITLFIII